MVVVVVVCQHVVCRPCCGLVWSACKDDARIHIDTHKLLKACGIRCLISQDGRMEGLPAWGGFFVLDERRGFVFCRAACFCI